MVKYESGNFHDKNWSETIGTYSGGAVIPDEETALKIAKAIFDGMEKSKGEVLDEACGAGGRSLFDFSGS